VAIQKNSRRIVKISVAAAEDLKDIWAYVAQHNENAAGKLIKEITGKFVLLGDNPLAGRGQDKFLVGLRSFVLKNYFIFYIPQEDGIEVLRVLHGSRDIESIFENFFDSLSEADSK
jgi:toxin ParE1/3/4